MRRVNAPIPFLAPIALFTAGGALGLGVTYDLRLSLPWFVSLVLGVVCYAGIARAPRPRLALVAALMALWCTGYSLFLIVQYRHLGFGTKLGLAARLGQLTSGPFPNVTPLFIDPNAAASFIAPGLPLIIGLALAARGLRRAAWIVAAVIVAAGVLLTASRGAFAALAAAGVLWGLLRLQGRAMRHGAIIFAPRRRQWMVAAAICGLVAFGILALAGDPRIQRALDSALFRAEDRLALYRNGLFLALEFPFSGIGPGRVFGQMYSRFQLLIVPTFLGYAHHLFLGVWLAQGLPGLAGFAWLLVATIRRIAPTLHTRDLEQQGAAIACCVLLFHGITDAPQYDSSWPTMILAFGLLALIAAPAATPGAGGDQPAGPANVATESCRGSGGRRLALAALVTGLVALTPHLVAAGAANYAAILHARAMLAPGLSQDERVALMAESIAWVNHGLRLASGSPLVQKRLGMLALDQGDYPRAIAALERARAVLGADQATRKALGLAYVWNGEPLRGARLLAQLDNGAEIREELNTWPYAWEERGRSDLAVYARQAAQAMDTLPPGTGARP